MKNLIKYLRKNFNDYIIDSNFSGEHILLEDIPEVISKLPIYEINLYTVDYEGNKEIKVMFRSFSKKECDKAFDLLPIIQHDERYEIELIDKPMFQSLKKLKKGKR